MEVDDQKNKELIESQKRNPSVKYVLSRILIGPIMERDR